MAYCTAAEVLDMLKEDMLNVIIGDNYIENEDERIQAITPIVEQAMPMLRLTVISPSGTRCRLRRHRR